MWARVTIDRNFVIHAIEVRTVGMPYPGACDRIEPAYAKLVGANLVQGFRKRLHDDMGGVARLHARDRAPGLAADGGGADVRGPAARERGRRQSRSSSTAATRSKRRPTPCAATIRSGIGAQCDACRAKEQVVKIHEYQGKEIFRKFGMADAARHSGVLRRRGRARRARRSAATSGSSRRRSTPAAAARAAASRSRARSTRCASSPARSSACSSSRTRPARAARRCAGC